MNRALHLAGGVLAATAFSLATTINVFAADSNSTSADGALKDALTSLIGSDDATVTEQTKEETVYVTTDAAGKPSQIKVTDRLVNAKKATDLIDASSLSNIEAVDKDYAYVRNDDGTLTWFANGDDVSYQGELSAQTALPVDMRITYWLDGNEISGEQLAGKTGHVKIRYDFTNNSASAGVNTPFVMLTALVLPGDDFSGAKVSSGRIIDDGDRTVVIGMAMPGMQESLGVGRDTIDLPDYVEFEVDAIEFSLGTVMTMGVVLSGDDVDTSALDDLSGAGDALSEAMNALIDGTSQLYDGMAQLALGSAVLDEGVQALSQGNTALSDGLSELKTSVADLPASTSALARGSRQLQSALAEAKDGSQDLAAAAHAVDGGAQQTKSGVEALSEAPSQIIDTIGSGASDAENTLLKGTDGVAAYLAGAKSTLEGAQGAASSASALIGDKSSTDDTTVAGALNAAAAALSKDGALDTKPLEDASDAASAASEALDGNAATLSSNASQLSSAATTLSGAESGLSNAAGDLSSASSALAAIDTTDMKEEQIEAINAAKAAVDTASTSVGSASSSMSDAALAAQDAASVATGSAGAAGDAADAAEDAADAATQAKTALAGADTATAAKEVDKAIEAAGSAKSQADAAATGIGGAVSQGIDPAISANAAVASGLALIKGAPAGESASATGLYALQDGIAQIVAAMGDAGSEGTLLYGTNAVASGLDGLSAGMGSAASGAASIAAANEALAQASPLVVLGIGTLADGASQLSEGAGALAAASPQLTEGLNTAATGTGQLIDGMRQFNDEGISQISEAFSGDTATLSSRINPLMKAGKEYNNFTGLASGTEGSVRFIYRTPAIG